MARRERIVAVIVLAMGCSGGGHDAPPHDAPMLDAAIVDAAAVDAADIDAALDAPTDAALDAPTDAALDAPTDAALDPCVGAPEITVRVQYRHGFDDLLPHPGVRVIVRYPDATTVSTVTDATGRAAAPGVDGATVFVSGVIGTETPLHVFTRVPACTAIELRPPPWEYRGGGVPLGPTGFQFAAPPIRQNAVYGPCGLAHAANAALVTATILESSGCGYQHDATLLALSRDHVGISGWTILPHVDLAAIVDQILVVPPLDPPVPATVRWMNIPAGWGISDTAFFEGPGLHWIGATQGSGASAVPAPTFDHLWNVAPLGRATLVSTMYEVVPALGEIHSVERVRPSTDLVGSVDADDAMGTITQASAGIGPATGFSIRWTWGGNASHRGDLVIALVEASQGSDLRIYGPGTADELVVPGWPAELGVPAPDPAHLRVPLMFAFDLDDTTTYASALARGHLGRSYRQVYAGPEFPDTTYWRASLTPWFGP